MYARFRLYESDAFEHGINDADLYLFKGDSEDVFMSSTEDESAAEMIHMVSPDPGTYTVMIVGRDIITDPPGSQADVFLHTWIVADKTRALPNLVPVNARIAVMAGVPAAVRLRSPGLIFDGQADGTPASRYLGSVEHFRDGQLLGYTLAAVES
jgi:hypothetical protein